MIHVEDVGVQITLNTGIDLTTASNTVIKYIKPSGAVGEWTATTDGNNIQYTTIEGDIDEEGNWIFQGYTEHEGWKGHTEITAKEYIGNNIS